VTAETLAAQNVEAATPVDYVAERDADKPPEQRGSYRVVEDTMVLTSKRKTDPDLRLRRIFVWSSARADAAAHARTKKLDRARDDLERLQRGLGGRHYPDTDAVAARVAQIGFQALEFVLDFLQLVVRGRAIRSRGLRTVSAHLPECNRRSGQGSAAIFVL